MSDVAPKNQTEERFDPEYVHRVTFGNPPKTGVIGKLVSDHEWLELMRATGRFEGLKRTIEVTNRELYAYLRLGVSTQSASHLKFLGYETPEELTAEGSPIAALLPDHLDHRLGTYPFKFIDACEEEGVSAIVCQLAIRRGITEKHMEGSLSLTDLLYAFTNIVKKNVALTEASMTQPSVINYICDGTIPLDFLKYAEFSTQRLMAVAQEVLIADKHKELASVLLSDKRKFAKFTNALGYGNLSLASSVEKLKDTIDAHGYKVLDMDQPMLCMHKSIINGKRDFIGYEAAKFTEDFLKTAPSRGALNELRYMGYVDDVRVPKVTEWGSWMDSVRITFEQFHTMQRAGIDPSAAYNLIIDEGIPVESVIAGHEDEVVTSLLAGAL